MPMLQQPCQLLPFLKCSCSVPGTSWFLICVRCLENLLCKDCEVSFTYYTMNGVLKSTLLCMLDTLQLRSLFFVSILRFKST